PGVPINDFPRAPAPLRPAGRRAVPPAEAEPVTRGLPVVRISSVGMTHPHGPAGRARPAENPRQNPPRLDNRPPATYAWGNLSIGPERAPRPFSPAGVWRAPRRAHDPLQGRIAP